MSQHWRLTVNRSTCIGSGLCVSMASDLFHLDAGTSQPAAEHVDPDPAALEAAEACPTESIAVFDETGLIAPVE